MANNTTSHKLDRTLISIDNWYGLYNNLNTKDYNSLISWGVVIPQCLWAIWLQRNQNLFNKRKDNISFNNMINQATEFQLLIKANHNAKRGNHIIHVKWEPPSIGKFKLNTDGAVKHTPGEGGIGGVIRNHKGDWIVGFISREAFVNPILAELRALRQGLLMAVEFKTQPLEINSDSKEMITLLENDNHPYTNLTTECRSLLEKVKAAMPTHIFREQNKVADMLSKEGMKHNTFGKPTFLLVPPMCAKKLTWADIVGTMYLRKLNPSSNYVIGHTTAQASGFAASNNMLDIT